MHGAWMLRFVAIVKIPARDKDEYYRMRHICLIALGPLLKKYHLPELHWVQDHPSFKGELLPIK